MENREETVERWAGVIIPAVFRAETELQRNCPEWAARLRGVSGEDASALAREYCRAIAEIIVGE